MKVKEDCWSSRTDLRWKERYFEKFIGSGKYESGCTLGIYFLIWEQSYREHDKTFDALSAETRIKIGKIYLIGNLYECGCVMGVMSHKPRMYLRRGGFKKGTQ